jgi:hypothetical protein
MLEALATAWGVIKGVWTWLVGAGVIAVIGNYAKGRVDRGRSRVVACAPRLIPLGNRQPRPMFEVGVRNEGPGRARNLRISFAGRDAAGGEVAANTNGATPVLSLEGVAFWKTKQTPENCVIAYTDDFDNEYRTTFPIGQATRADGEFNMAIDGTKYIVIAPRPGFVRYFKIGR